MLHADTHIHNGVNTAPIQATMLSAVITADLKARLLLHDI